MKSYVIVQGSYVIVDLHLTDEKGKEEILSDSNGIKASYIWGRPFQSEEKPSQLLVRIRGVADYKAVQGEILHRAGAPIEIRDDEVSIQEDYKYIHRYGDLYLASKKKLHYKKDKNVIISTSDVLVSYRRISNKTFQGQEPVEIEISVLKPEDVSRKSFDVYPSIVNLDNYNFEDRKTSTSADRERSIFEFDLDKKYLNENFAIQVKALLWERSMYPITQRTLPFEPDYRDKDIVNSILKSLMDLWRKYDIKYFGRFEKSQDLCDDVHGDSKNESSEEEGCDLYEPKTKEEYLRELIRIYIEFVNLPRPRDN